MTTDHDDERRDVIRLVMRLIDYGKGADDPELDGLTIGQVAARLIGGDQPVVPVIARDDVDATAAILDRHYLAHCVANPSHFYGNDTRGRYWKCGCGAEETHVPAGITIKRAHHRHVAALIAADYATKEHP